MRRPSTVSVDTAGRHVEIYLDGHKASQGHRTVGEFEANLIEGTIKGNDDLDTGGDSLLIAQTKVILRDLGIEDFDGYVLEDKASNAPVDDSYVMSHKDREVAVRDGVNPAEKQAEISENIDKAESKMDKADKKNTKHKNDARPRSNG